MRVDAHITRTGVFEYRQPDGSIRREYRPEDEVFHEDSLDSFAQKPVTDDHPPEGRVTGENAGKLARGTLGENVRRDGDHVAASIVILDAALVRKIERGKVQVSCGYTCDLDETPGVTPAGERYDAIQRNIRGNHVAVVDVGRAGPTARIRMDAAEMIDPDDKDIPMDFEKLYNEAKAQLATVTAERDTARGEAVAQRTRADQAEAQRMDGAAVQALVTARVALVGAAQPHLGEMKLDSMTDVAIKRAVVEKAGVKLDEKASDATVDGAYLVAIDSLAKARQSLGGARQVVVQGRADGAGPEGVEEAARRKMYENAANVWRNPTPAA